MICTSLSMFLSSAMISSLSETSSPSISAIVSGVTSR
jgi:hypothetical protein